MDHTKNFEKYEQTDEEELDEMLITFYEGALAQGKGLSKKELLKWVALSLIVLSVLSISEFLSQSGTITFTT